MYYNLLCLNTYIDKVYRVRNGFDEKHGTYIYIYITERSEVKLKLFIISCMNLYVI